MGTAFLKLKADWQYDTSPGRSHYLVKAVERGKVIGRAHGWYAAGEDFVVEKIELDPPHRGKGHGAAMIEALRVQARSQRCARFVFAGVMRSNEGAARLYRALGAEAGPYVHDSCDFLIAPP